MATASNKIRTNVYLDADIKKKAQEIFKQYGIGLSYVTCSKAPALERILNS